MSTRSIATAGAKRAQAMPPSPHHAAVAMAKKFEHVFQHAFPISSKVAAKSTSSGRARLFITLMHHEAPTLNRDAAAHWASRSLPAAALDEWFAASGLEKKKDLFIALQVSASTLSRAKADTTLDTAVTERMLRQSELFVRAAEVFGEDGATWMTTPHDLLDGKAPLAYATNEFGGAKVRQILNAIEYGGVV
ncbi:MAG: antitoxin Xre/MbcA/ParS toxin-binding domain-containing protein [Pseudomonadota bacterium]